MYFWWWWCGSTSIVAKWMTTVWWHLFVLFCLIPFLSSFIYFSRLLVTITQKVKRENGKRRKESSWVGNNNPELLFCMVYPANREKVKQPKSREKEMIHCRNKHGLFITTITRHFCATEREKSEKQAKGVSMVERKAASCVFVGFCIWCFELMYINKCI